MAARSNSTVELDLAATDPFKNNETQEREKESCELNFSKLAIDG